MISASKVSRSVIVMLLTSALLSAASWCAYLKWRPGRAAPDPELAQLSGELEELRSNTDEVRDDWRKRRAGIQQNAWTRQSIDRLAIELGTTWQWDWSANNRATVQRLDLPMEEWANFVAVIESLTRKPGLTVESMEIRASGRGQERRFTALRLKLRFQLHDGANPSSASFRPDPSGSLAGMLKETKPNKDPQ